VNDVDINIKLTGADQVAQGMKKATDAVKANSVAVEDAGKKAGAASLQVGQLGSTFGLAGQAIGKVNPQLGQLTTIVGSATGVIQTLTTAGLGPLGIAFTAVNVALTAGVTAWDSYNESTKKLEENIRQNTIPTIDELVNKLATAAQRTQMLARLSSGGGTLGEYRASEEQGAAYLQRVNDQLNLARRRGSNADVVRFERERERAEGVLDYRRRLLINAELTNPLGIEEEGSISFEPRGSRRYLDENGNVATRQSARGGGETQAARLSRLMGGAFRSSPLSSLTGDLVGNDKEAENLTAQKDAQLEAARAYEDSERAKTAFLEEEKHKRDELIMQEAQSQIEVWGEYGAQLGSIFATAAQSSDSFGAALANGFKQWAKGFSIQEVAKGTAAIAEGLVAATNPVTAAMAPGYFAGAAQHFAAAAVVGGLGAAIPGGGGGGGSRSGGASGSIPRERGQMGSGDAPKTVVVNLNGGVIAAADEAQFGRVIQRALGRANSRYGEST